VSAEKAKSCFIRYRYHVVISGPTPRTNLPHVFNGVDLWSQFVES
jgi:hypothetical protein